MSYKIDEIEGIGPAYAEKLGAANIATTEDFLELCSDAPGRKKVSTDTGVGESLLLKWANMADMMRIAGIATQFAELLEASGVDTVLELGTRRADNLTAALMTVNGEKKLCRTVPSQAQVQRWIDQAKQLEPRITH